MKKKTKKNLAFVGWNLLTAVCLLVGLVVWFTIWLGRTTEHDVEVSLPSVFGMTLDEARAKLAADDLRLEVVDSTYTKAVPLGTIYQQNPREGRHVKHGRTVYVYVNSTSPRQVPLPDLRGWSMRQASANLQGLQFKVAETLYEPGRDRDLVLDIRVDGESVEPGTRLEEGTSLTLVVSYGVGTEYVEMPNLRGMHLTDAEELLRHLHLVEGMVEFDEEPTEDNRRDYIIYQQSEESGRKVKEGTTITLKLSLDIDKAVGNEEDSENFF